MQEEVDRAKAWLTAPFVLPLPLWETFAYFILFVVVAWVVVDHIDILKQGLK